MILGGVAERFVGILCLVESTPASAAVTKDFAVLAKVALMLAAIVGKSNSQSYATREGRRKRVI